MEKVLSLKNLNKAFGENAVIRDLSLNIGKGRFVTLLGPSGCGKTTTIRMIAGLDAPDSGSIFLCGNDVTALPPDKRSVNTVFQNYALFPHYNVKKNIAYGLKIRKLPTAEIDRKVDEILELVELSGFGGRMPSELSGGQRQRVAIARALVLGPEVLLLDEPLGALDLQLRRQMQKELKSIQTRLGITFIYITHDQEEAISMSDDIVLMNEGVIVQKGSPREIFERPATKFAASFIGESNIIDGTVSGQDESGLSIDSAAGAFLAAKPDIKASADVSVSVRPADVELSRSPVPGFNLRGRVKSAQYTGSIVRVSVELDCGDVTAEVSAHRPDTLGAGDEVFLHWNPARCAVIGGYAEVDKP